MNKESESDVQGQSWNAEEERGEAGLLAMSTFNPIGLLSSDSMRMCVCVCVDRMNLKYALC